MLSCEHMNACEFFELNLSVDIIVTQLQAINADVGVVTYQVWIVGVPLLQQEKGEKNKNKTKHGIHLFSE